jgi:hypothetical protein
VGAAQGPEPSTPRPARSSRGGERSGGEHASGDAETGRKPSDLFLMRPDDARARSAQSTRADAVRSAGSGAGARDT